MYDLLIRGATLLDAAQALNTVGDLAVSNRRIVAIGDLSNESAEQELDATGCFLTPGLIDLHMHVAPLTEIGVSAESSCFPAGVTTVLDCGSAGAATYPAHRAAVLTSRVRTKILLHACSAGLATGRYLENPDPQYFDAAKIAACVEEYPEIVGLKIRQGAEIVGSLGLQPLRETIALAEKHKLPVMVHCSNPPHGMDELLDLLRPGDIFTHVFQDKGASILTTAGTISRSAWQARERGVIMDVGNANIHFSFAVARQAMQEGFWPDTISTDLTVRSLYRRPAVFNLLHVLSKYLAMGMPLSAVMQCCTQNPARALGLSQEIGTLAVGSCADLAVLSLRQRPLIHGDRVGELLTGTQSLRAMLTVRAGEVVYRDQDF